MLPETITERIDRILTESPIGLSAAARLFGSFRSGRPTNPATVYRWALEGAKLPDGTRVHLEFIRLAGRLMTSRAACVRFIESQQTDAAPKATPVATTRSEAARVKASAAAGRKLEAMGA